MNNILTTKLLDTLKRKLSGSSTRSIHLNAIPGTSRIKLQITELNNIIKKDSAKSFLDELLESPKFKFNLELQNIDTEKFKKPLNRLKYLARQNKDYFLEHGIEPFGFGYPIIAKRDKKNPKKVIFSPLLIWDLDIIEDTRKLNSFIISRNEDCPIKLNEVLLNFIESNDNVNFDKIPTDFLDDGLIDIEELNILINKFLEAFGINKSLTIDFWENFTDIEKIKDDIENISFEPQIFNSGVFGLYLSQKESIIKDIEELKTKTLHGDNSLFEYEDRPFSPVKTDQSQQQVLSALKSFDKFVIHGPPGTGKSQTLTAILSSALNNNKRCLVVCEKKTALDVIQQNLYDIGLSEFSVLIEDPVKDRKAVVDHARNIIGNIDNEIVKNNYERNIEFEGSVLSALNISERNHNNTAYIIEKIDAVHKLKNLLNDNIIDGDNYKGILSKLDQKFDALEFEKENDLSALKLKFVSEEYVSIKQSFRESNQHFYSFNPYKTYYNNLNSAFISNHEQNEFSVILNESIHPISNNLVAINDLFFLNEIENFEETKNELLSYLNTTSNDSHANLNALFDTKISDYTYIENALLAVEDLNVKSIKFRILSFFSAKYKEINKAYKIYLINIKALQDSGILDVSMEKMTTLEAVKKHLEDIKQLLNKYKLHAEKYNDYLLNINKLNSISFNKENFKLLQLGSEISNQIISINNLVDSFRLNLNKYAPIRSYHLFFSSQEPHIKELLKKLAFNKLFKEQFENYYFGKVLYSKGLDNIIDNGNPYEYFNIEEDLNNVNVGTKWSIILNQNRNRKNSLNNFRGNQNLKPEQIFSKRSSTKNKKLSLRKIIDTNFELFTSMFPIVLTNPTSVASMFPLQPDLFDIVLFDEASQLRIEDTLSSLYRGKVKIVSGDQKQMPPSSYFSSVEIEDNSDDEEEEQFSEVEYAFKESLLEFSVDMGFKNLYLDMHYRSKHPDLIEYSNKAFYGGRLVALPQATEYNSIEFFQINGLYSKRTNLGEAKSIVEYLKNNVDETKSIGIATFNLDQRNLILDEINFEMQTNQEFSDKMFAIESNGFFVKNLENIQGDERDIIILSTTFGKDENDNFRQAFGPISNKEKGHKLLNVIITRARIKMVIMTSIPEDTYLNYKSVIEENGLIGKGVLYSYLSYARAVYENNLSAKESILNLISLHSPDLKEKSGNNLAQDVLSTKVIKILSSKLNSSYSFTTNQKLGGYVFDICINSNGSPQMIIDLDGKSFYNLKDDYLFDLGRKNVVNNSGLIYYRLWSANLFNNLDEEVNMLLRKLIGSNELV